MNRKIFENKLPKDLKIEWSVRLNKTAGKTLCKRIIKEGVGADGKQVINKINVASIELATKVVDDPEKLRSTLCHELCHAAAWLIDNNANPPHGPIFRKWFPDFFLYSLMKKQLRINKQKINHDFLQGNTCDEQIPRTEGVNLS